MMPLRLILKTLSCLALLSGPANALDPLLSPSQYKFTQWGIDEGAPRSIRRIVQGRDGYLWLGTATGLYRFDGTTFELVPAASPGPSPPSVASLLLARSGEIWVGYDSGAIAVLRGGVLRNVPMNSTSHILALAQTSGGEIWAAIARNREPLARFANGRWVAVGAGWGLPEGQPWNLLAGRNGTLWVSQRNRVFALKSGRRRFEPVFDADSPSVLSEDRRGNIWVSNEDGTRAIADGQGRVIPSPAHPYPTPTSKRTKRTIFDRDGNLWGRSDFGIFRLKVPYVQGAASAEIAVAGISRFQPRAGFARNVVSAVQEDSEGDIWIATDVSLGRLRPTNVVIEPNLGNTAKWGNPLLGTSDGAVYVGEADGVYRVLPGGNPLPFVRGSEPQALCEGPDGTVWSVLQDRVVGIRAGRATILPGVGDTDMGVADCAVDHEGHLWLTALYDGALRWADGRWQKILVPRGPSGLRPGPILRTRNHGLLVAFSNGGLGAVTGEGRVSMLIARDNRLGDIRTMYDGGDGLLLGGEFGLAKLWNGRLTILSAIRTPALLTVSGIAQTSDGETWLRTAGGIVRISAAELARCLVPASGGSD